MAELHGERLRVQGATEGHPTFLLTGPVVYLCFLVYLFDPLLCVYVCVLVRGRSVPQFLGPALEGRALVKMPYSVFFSCLLGEELTPAAPLGLMSQRRE